MTGRVQGVFFRASTATRARNLGLDGHAINLPDGRVEVLLAGPSGKVSELTTWLEKGPPAAKVTKVDCFEAEMPTRKGFQTG